MQKSPDAMNKMMAEASADFARADANGDGVLDLAEYTTFHNGQIDTWRARGHFVDAREDKIAATFQIFDEYNTETQGISEADYLTMMRIWMGKFEALKQKQAQPGNTSLKPATALINVKNLDDDESDDNPTNSATALENAAEKAQEEEKRLSNDQNLIAQTNPYIGSVNVQALKDDIKRRVSYIRESLNNINRCDLNNKETQTEMNLSNSVVEKKGIKKDLELIEEEVDNESRVSTV